MYHPSTLSKMAQLKRQDIQRDSAQRPLPSSELAPTVDSIAQRTAGTAANNLTPGIFTRLALRQNHKR